MPYKQEEQMILCQLGDNIRRIRKQKGLSQEALAFQVDLDRTYIGSTWKARRTKCRSIEFSTDCEGIAG
ncbi:helix-turn-helix domain-containing protein [Flavilitoribacter nigricans]|uniref:helix-turn-helix domain-containing protein n=1 Tax=Flavilitoribacter nigricans TaxID=70997 RepID=UPI0026BEE7EB